MPQSIYLFGFKVMVFVHDISLHDDAVRQKEYKRGREWEREKEQLGSFKRANI